LIRERYERRSIILTSNRGFADYSIKVVFVKPGDPQVCFGQRGTNIRLQVFESYGKTLCSNSYSQLAVQLSDGAWLIVATGPRRR
jgi:hypothetical protein